MAAIKIDQFHGIAPRQHPTQLGDGMAITAHNVKLKNGKLVPLRQPSKATNISILMEKSYLNGAVVNLTEIANSRSIHVWRKRDGNFDFLLFPGITWMSEGNIADDERTRVIISGDTGESFTDTTVTPNKVTLNTPVVYMRNPSTGVKIIHNICKNPLPAPRVARVSSSALTDNRRYTYFFVTWVDQYGYESPVSAQSKPGERVTTADGWTISVSSGQVTATKSGSDTKTAPIADVFLEGTAPNYTAATFYNLDTDGDLEYEDGDKIEFAPIGSEKLPSEAVSIRVYKVVTGTETGRIQFIKEISKDVILSGESKFRATVKDEDAGEVLKEIESPYPDMRCVLDVPGAYYCGFSPSHPKTVCFSEVDLIYSWPISYQYDIKDNIVALAVTSNTVFALTDGWPYVLSGTHPSGMTVTKLAGPAACVAPRGVCVFKNAVYYVGHQGLMTIYNDADAGTVCANLTDKVFTKEQWQALNPSSCVMGQFDGALHLFFTKADNSHYGISIDLTESANAVTTHDEVAKCVCVDDKGDKMYYVREGV